MRFRKLRIAWSVFWGLVSVLLMVLWVRSYWWSDSIWTSHVGMSSTTGVGQVAVRSMPTNYLGPQWTSFPAKDSIFISPRFAFRPGANLSYVNVPYWFVMLIGLILAAAPWRPRRFTLRTLLTATTLVAVVAALIAWVTR
jgi:hypothetical protein